MSSHQSHDYEPAMLLNAFFTETGQSRDRRPARTSVPTVLVESVGSKLTVNISEEREPAVSNSRYQMTTDLIRQYLQDIGRVPLLQKDEEIAISRQIQRYLALLQQQQEAIDLGDGKMSTFATLMQVRDRLAVQLGYPPSLEAWAEAAGIKPASLKRSLAEGKCRWAELTGVKVAELEKLQAAGIRAKQHLIAANLRLVVSVAKKYQNRGLDLLDLIQEGTLGLERAAEKFDPAQGCRFSTYAYWWIRQGITRAIATQSRLIRLPVHITEKMNKIKQAQRKISQTKGRAATLQEIAQFINLETEEVRQILNKVPYSVSLEIKVGKDKDTELAELLESQELTPEATAINEALHQDLQKLLEDLTGREREVMQLRYGFKDGNTYSLSDISEILNLSRERVRQIELRALQKLRHPRRRLLIQDYLETLNG